MKIIIDTRSFTLRPEIMVPGEMPLETISKELRSIDADAIRILLEMIKRAADPDVPIVTMEQLKSMSITDINYLDDARFSMWW